MKGIGFIPGEKLTMRVEGHGTINSFQIETTDYNVKADGTFYDSEVLPLDDPIMHWEVHVVHQRGIACLSFETQR